MRTRTRGKKSVTGRRKSRVTRNKSRRKRQIYGGAVGGGGGDQMNVVMTPPQQRAQAVRNARKAAYNRVAANNMAAQAAARGVTPMEGVIDAPAKFLPSGIKHKNHKNHNNQNNQNNDLPSKKIRPLRLNDPNYVNDEL